jgi:hypothetical protein
MTSAYPVIIFAHLNTSKIKDAESYFINYDNSEVINPTYYYTTFKIVENVISADSKLVITSNGIDGVGYTDNTFNIDINKFNNTKVYFVVRVKTANDVPIKSIPLIPLSSIDLKIVDSNGTDLSATFNSNFQDLSSEEYGGFFKGYFVSTLTGSDVKIQAIYNDTYSLTGYSNTFNIYPSAGIYNIRIINEDNNQSAQYESLALQQILQDKTSFFRDFLGQIVGDSSSDPNTLGIEIYEKISNFVQNNSDVVYSNLPQFTSMLDSIKDVYTNYNLQYPPSLQRLINIFCVPLSYQIGGKNQYNFNFDNKGFVNSTVYGLNKGNKIDFLTGVLYRNTNPSYYKPVIAHEKFSGNYTLVSPLIPDALNVVYIDPVLKSYALSSYNTDWGWGLILPNDFENVDIPKYYEFYEYIDRVDNTLLQKYIDFDNPKNTYLNNCSSYRQYAEDGGIIDNILVYHLYTNTGIIST